MSRKIKLSLLAIIAALGVTVAYGDNTTTISRLLLDHPNLGHQGGATLHSHVAAIYTRIGDNVDSRYEEFTAQADSTTVTHFHNFNIPFSDLIVVLWSGTGTAKTLISDPAGAGWTIAATSGFLKTKIDITTPSSGGPHDFSVEVKSGFGELSKQDANAVAITGGSVLGVIASLNDTDSLFNLGIQSTSTLTSNKTLTIDLNDGNRTLELSGNLIKSGSDPLTLITSGTTSATYPAGTVDLLGTDEAQVVTAKDIDGGTASNTSRITLPKASSGTLTALTRKEGTVVYDTTAQKPYYDNGTSLIAIGSGSSSDNNYVTNGGAEETTTPAAWTTYDDGAVAVPVDGTGGSPSAISAIARTTTAGELIYGTGTWKLAKSAANGQGEGWAYDFTLAPKSQLYNSLVDLRFDFYVTANYAAGDVRAYVYDKDLATVIAPAVVTCGGGSTPDLSKSTTACHAQLAWLSTISDDYRLVIHTATTNASAWDLFVDNLYIGERITAVGATVGDWQTYTPTGSWTANVTYTGRKRRVGDSMEYQVSVALSGGAPTPTVGLVINQPSGETIDTTKIADTSRGILGDLTIFDADGAGSGRLMGEVTYDSATAVGVSAIDEASASNHWTVAITPTAPISFGTAGTDKIVINYRVPIAQFASSAMFGDNNVEYAFNTSTTDADDTTSFGYGPAGTLLPGAALTARRDKTVRFITNIKPTDTVVLEWQDANASASSGWTVLASGSPISQINVGSYEVQNGVTYGVGIRAGTATTTDVIVSFGQYAYPSGATYGAAGQAWNSTTDNGRWRLKKFSAGAAVGFGIADATTSGLVSTTTQTIAGPKTLTSELTTKVNHTDLGSTASTDTTNSLLRSGLFTWSGAGTTNVTSLSSSGRPMMWTLVGKVVSVSGTVSIQCTSGADADTIFTMTLPITPTSNFVDRNEVNGTAVFIPTNPATAARPVIVEASTSAKTAKFQFSCNSASSGREIFYQFTYRLN